MNRTNPLGPVSIFFVLAIAATPHGFGAERVRVLQEREWPAETEPAPPHREIVADEQLGLTVLKVEHAVGTPLMLTLATFADPEVRAQKYALRGQIRYENVTEPGMLELLNHFASGSSYFTRTVFDSGPLQRIHGTSDWRKFELPFVLTGPNDEGFPTQIELKLHLPAAGTVWISPLTLVEFPGWTPADGLGVGTAGTWWTNRQAGWVGGSIGALFGLLGGLVGVLASIGRGRTLMQAALACMLLFGCIGLIVGIAALALQQPYHVYYPPLLIGILGTILPLSLWPVMLRQYEQREMRRMEALDSQ